MNTHIQTHSLNELVNELCSVCGESVFFQSKNPVQIEKCGHFYHKACLKQWCKTGNNMNACLCPLCKERFIFKSDAKSVKTAIKHKVKSATEEQIRNVSYSNLYDTNDANQIRDKIDSMRTRSHSNSLSSASTPRTPSPKQEQGQEQQENEQNMYIQQNMLVPLPQVRRQNIHNNDLALGQRRDITRRSPDRDREKSPTKKHKKSPSYGGRRHTRRR